MYLPNPRHWALWREKRCVIAVLLTTYLAAVVASWPTSVIEAGQLLRFVMVAGVGALTTVACWRMERARKFLDSTKAPNLAAVWTFAGALVLDATLAIGVAVVIYAVQWGSQRKLYAGRVHIYFFNISMVVLAVRAAQLVHVALLSGLVLVAVNMVLLAIYLTALGTPAAIRRIMSVSGQLTEVVTFALGWVTADLVARHVVLAFAMIPVVVGLQYAALWRSVTRLSSIDSATGALTARAWHALATLKLSQVREAIVLHIMVTDLGGQSWADCAKVVRAFLRPEDLVGRAEDGFVVLVAGAGDAVLAEVLGLQMRARLTVAGMGTHIGSAVTPDGDRLIDLQGLTVTAGADVIVRSVDIRV